jgi:hypothetical protein
MRAATAARPKEAWIPAAPPVVIGDGDAVATGVVPLDGAEIPVEATLVALVGDSVTVEKMTVGMPGPRSVPLLCFLGQIQLTGADGDGGEGDSGGGAHTGNGSRCGNGGGVGIDWGGRNDHGPRGGAVCCQQKRPSSRVFTQHVLTWSRCCGQGSWSRWERRM